MRMGTRAGLVFAWFWLSVAQAQPTGKPVPVVPAPIHPAPPSLLQAMPAPQPAAPPQGEKPSVSLTDILLVSFNGLLALFTLLLWLATAGLWKATKGMLAAAEQQAVDLKKAIDAAQISAEAARRTALVSQQTLQLTQRPVMAVDDLAGIVVPGPGNRAAMTMLEIKVRWKNCGAVFATNCALKTEYVLADPGADVQPFVPEPAQDSSLVGPGGEIDCMPVSISLGDAHDIFMGLKTIIIWACCKYSSHLVDKIDELDSFETLYGYVMEIPSSPSGWNAGEAPDLRFRFYPGGGKVT